MKYQKMQRPGAKAKEPSTDRPDDHHRKNRVEKTYQELKDQPEAFERTLQAVSSDVKRIARELKDREIDTVILIGCGDSWFVGNSLISIIERLSGFCCVSVEAYEFYAHPHNNIGKRSIVIGQSASGTTVSVLKGLSYAREAGAVTIGMGNTKGSSILEEYDHGIYVPVTRKGWPTQATTSAMGALLLLFCMICREKGINVEEVCRTEEYLYGISGLMREAISLNEEPISLFCKQHADVLYAQATGSGPSYAVAQIAAAKIKELCPSHASSYPLEEFHHYRSLKPQDLLILIAPQGASREREIDTALVGAYDEGIIVTIAHDAAPELVQVSDLVCKVPAIDEALAPFVYAIPVHLLAYYLAREKFAQAIGYPSYERC